MGATGHSRGTGDGREREAGSVGRRAGDRAGRPRSGAGRRAFGRVVALGRHQERLEARFERWVERRWPALYDARHAARGFWRVLAPLVGPLLGGLVVLGFLVVLALPFALVVALMGSLGIGLPDLPAVSLPSPSLPGWLRSILDAGWDVIAAVGGALGAAAAALKWPVVGLFVVVGIIESRRARARRRAAEGVGRDELVRRLAVVLGEVDRCARARDSGTVGDAALDRIDALPRRPRS